MVKSSVTEDHYGEPCMPECLYCRQTDRKFTSVEHVIPESLGNAQRPDQPRPIVLPVGVVCDRCNNGKLSALDQSLIMFGPIAFLKTVRGVESKGGRLPTSRHNNAKISMPAPGNVVFESNSPKAFVHDGKGNITMNVKSHRRMTNGYARELTRALFKMTLGCMYIDNSDVAMSEEYDPVRRRILGLEKFRGSLVMPRKIPQEVLNGPLTSRLEYAFRQNIAGEVTVVTEFTFCGLSLTTAFDAPNILRRDVVSDDLFIVLDF